MRAGCVCLIRFSSVLTRQVLPSQSISWKDRSVAAHLPKDFLNLFVVPPPHIKDKKDVPLHWKDLKGMLKKQISRQESVQ